MNWSNALALAASPIFAIMALLTMASGRGPAEMLCSAGYLPGLGSMVTMYWLMSGFHIAPWLRLLSRGRSGRA
jgi:hypothetical protein